MKYAKACARCRSEKRKCVASTSSHSCHHCHRKNVPCSLESFRALSASRPALLPRPVSSVPPSVPRQCGSSRAIDDLKISDELQDSLVAQYIDRIHGQPHTLFHPSTLKRQIKDGSVSTTVLAAIIALGARLSGRDDARLLIEKLSKRARTVLKSDIDNICLENVQASILVGNLCGAEGDPGAESLFFGVAIRMAQVIQLPKPETGDDNITTETRMRVYWSAYMIDRWHSAGLGIPRQLREVNYDLPMLEQDFYSMEPGTSNLNPQSHRPGLWAQMIKLAQIFGDVQDLHRQHVEGVLDDSQAEATAEDIARAFERFTAFLPPEHILNEQNIDAHISAGLGRAFIALHLGYHHYATLMYFQYLDTQVQRTPVRLAFADRCKRHAAAFSDLLKVSMQAKGSEAVYVIVAHMAVVSSAVLLYTLTMGAEHEIALARDRLQVNFEKLIELRRYWPAVEAAMQRLFAFQEACTWSADPNTHRIDKWMVKFLLQYALPVEGQSLHTPDKESSHQTALVRSEIARPVLDMLRNQ